MLFNTMRGGYGSAGMGPWSPPMSLFGEADNAELRGADSPRLSMGCWGQALPVGDGELEEGPWLFGDAPPDGFVQRPPVQVSRA